MDYIEELKKIREELDNMETTNVDKIKGLCGHKDINKTIEMYSKCLNDYKLEGE